MTLLPMLVSFVFGNFSGARLPEGFGVSNHRVATTKSTCCLLNWAVVRSHLSPLIPPPLCTQLLLCSGRCCCCEAGSPGTGLLRLCRGKAASLVAATLLPPLHHAELVHTPLQARLWRTQHDAALGALAAEVRTLLSAVTHIQARLGAMDKVGQG